jgi:hypothetical protein
VDREGANPSRGDEVNIRTPAVVALSLVLSAAGIGAQAQGAAGTNPSVGPGEPEIVLPQVILQIEDLSVEKVEAQLPPEDELLPPERKIPVLDEGELAIGEPALPAAGVITETAGTQSRDRLLTSDINLGAGSQNRIMGSISLKTLGKDPRFSLLFNHETLDGFSGNLPGSGFNLRNDDLDGTLKLRMGSIDTEIGGRFSENESGLQGNSPFLSRLGRTLDGTVGFSAAPLDWLTLSAGARGGGDSLTLQGASPPTFSGYWVTPSLAAQARFGPVRFGLETRYWFRSDPATTPDSVLVPGGLLHRFQASATFGADLPAALTLEGSGGWFVNSAALSVFPFSLTLSGTPVQFLTFSLSGGYRVVTNDMHDLVAVSPYALPVSLIDDRGWFGDASVQFSLTHDLDITFKGSLMASEAMPVGSFVADPGTGLLPVTSPAGKQLSTEAGIRWVISPSFSLSAGWTHQYLDVPFFTPLDSLKLELLGLEPGGKFGGSFSMSLASATGASLTQVLQLPVARLSGFWKVSDAVKLQLDGDDLLWPLLPEGSRVDTGPYVAPGFRITGSIGISL